MITSAQTVDPLHELARAWGLETRYEDGFGQQRETPAEAVLAILKALGERVDDASGATEAMDRRRRAERAPGFEPVVVAWQGVPEAPELRLPLGDSEAAADCRIRLEDGTERHWTLDLSRQLALRESQIDGERLRSRAVPLPDPLPLGYHDLEVVVNGRSHRSRIICAPRQAFAPPADRERSWGAFLPLYSLHDPQAWGIGDYRLLEHATTWVQSLGAATLGTLPLLPTFLDRLFDPSPYAPVSRLFWSEVYVDPSLAPEFAAPSVQDHVATPAVEAELRRVRNLLRVDYRAVNRLKRDVFARMRRALPGFPERLRAFEDYSKRRPEARRYAQFRAATEIHGPWRSWPRNAALPEDVEPEAILDHLYAQWLADEQLGRASDHARQNGLGLYLDLPLGVHPAGYDAWRQRDDFVDGLSVGAPPDRFTTGGQNWGFAPLHPQRTRQQGYPYFIETIRHHCARAGILRIDHVLGLHRLYCIPDGFEAADGAYLHYRADELYAVLCLESHRHKAILVGEDLGAVPPHVRPALRRHGIHRMFVLQAALMPDKGTILSPAPEVSLATLNTHDMAPFAAFWAAQDIPNRVSLGLIRQGDRLDAAQRRRETVRDAIIETLRREGWIDANHDPSLQEILRGCLSHLAASKARMVFVNLEDCWLETQPQNVPGTGPEHGNWTRRVRDPMTALELHRHVREILGTVDRLRRGGGR